MTAIFINQILPNDIEFGAGSDERATENQLKKCPEDFRKYFGEAEVQTRTNFLPAKGGEKIGVNFDITVISTI